MDTLELIRTFREVAARGSFSRAADALMTSRANVSKYVAELESRLGVRLLNRTTRSVSLTDAGALLLERSAPLVEMIALTTAELQDHARAPRGRVRMSAPYSLGQAVLPGLLAAFLRQHPHVGVSLRLDNRPLDMAEEGIDIALRVGRINDGNYIVRKLRQLSIAVCASPAYWRAHGLPQHPDALSQHQVLLHTAMSHGTEWQFTVDGKPYAVPVQARLDATDSAPLIAVALEGMGVIRLPQLQAQQYLADGRLQAVLQDFAPRDVWLYAMYAQRRNNSAAMRALLEYLEKHWPQGPAVP